MSVKRMHYLFKQKLNKVDSSQNVNFRIPEIDVMLREAELMFIRQRILKSTHRSQGSLDFNNELSDDMISIIKTATITEMTDGAIDLPEDYLYYIASEVSAVKDGSTQTLRGLFKPLVEEKTSFNNSSFEWGEVNLALKNGKIEFDAPDFSVSEIKLTYVKKPLALHDAEDYSGTVTVPGSEIIAYMGSRETLPKGLGVSSVEDIIAEESYTLKGYKDLNGTILFGYADSELPYHTHDQIVDIAVMRTLQSISNTMDFQNDKTTQQPKQ